LRGGIRSELCLRVTGIRRSDRIHNSLADLVGKLTCLVTRNQLDDVGHQARGNANQRHRRSIAIPRLPEPLPS
jgi:hypothetical protein